MHLIPHEFTLAGIYLPPLLVAGVLGLAASVVTAQQLNRFRLSRYFFYPPLVFLALTVIYSVLIGTYLIRI